jgi:hypothetical protein
MNGAQLNRIERGRQSMHDPAAARHRQAGRGLGRGLGLGRGRARPGRLQRLGLESPEGCARPVAMAECDGEQSELVDRRSAAERGSA